MNMIENISPLLFVVLAFLLIGYIIGRIFNSRMSLIIIRIISFILVALIFAATFYTGFLIAVVNGAPITFLQLAIVSLFLGLVPVIPFFLGRSAGLYFKNQKKF